MDSRVGDRVGIGAPIRSGHHIRQGGLGLSFRLILSHPAVILTGQHREYRDVHPIYTKTSMFTIRDRGTTEVKGVSLIFFISGIARLTQKLKNKISELILLHPPNNTTKIFQKIHSNYRAGSTSGNLFKCKVNDCSRHLLDLHAIMIAIVQCYFWVINMQRSQQT